MLIKGAFPKVPAAPGRSQQHSETFLGLPATLCWLPVGLWILLTASLTKYPLAPHRIDPLGPVTHQLQISCFQEPHPPGQCGLTVYGIFGPKQIFHHSGQ